MSFIYGLAFVLLLFAVIYISVKKQKLQTEYHIKTHPPKKYQEEFLKACELYLEYRKDPEEHSNPAKDAKCDAARHIQSQGFLPAVLENTRERNNKKPLKEILGEDGNPAYLSYHAIEHVLQTSFCECQTQDGLLSGYSQDPRFWNGSTFNIVEWNHYCYKMDEAFNQMVDRYLNEIGHAVPQKPGPKIDQTDPAYPYSCKD